MNGEQTMVEKDVIEIGKRVIKIEASAVAELEDRIDENFAKVVDLILNSNGRVIITGVGKSGIIARKIVATMNSTGTPALYLHPADAIHGDLGVVRKEDVVICISKSGDTIEVLRLIPIFKRIGVPVISMVGNLNSQLARLSDYVLNVAVKQEACPYNLAPTASTTATLAMGDALAIALLEKRNFTKENFALFHPGGNLGKRLLLKVEELMVSGKEVPIVHTSTPMKETIIEMTSKRLGATCVVDDDGKLVGIITDGDLRRLLQRTENVFALNAGEVMTKNPKTIKKDALAVTALQQMETYNITQLVVIDEGRRPIGMIHIHDLVKAGLSSSETDYEVEQ
jgi:arabinose-5-phosphate isomerase